MQSILSQKDRNRYRAMCSWRKKHKQPIPTEAEYKAYRNSENAGKHKSIGIDKTKGSEENRERYAEKQKSNSEGAKRSQRRRLQIKTEEDIEEEPTFTIRISEVIARTNARAIALTRSKPQIESWRI